MGKADRELIGQALLSIPGQIDKIHNAYREGYNNKFNQEIQARQLQIQMAQAQNAAEKHRQEMALNPLQENRAWVDLGLRRDVHELNKQKHADEPERERQRFENRGVEAIAKGLHDPDQMSRVLGQSFSDLTSQQGVGQLKGMKEEEMARDLKQSMRKARGAQRVREEEKTVGTIQRYPYKESKTTADAPTKPVAKAMSRVDGAIERMQKADDDYKILDYVKNEMSVFKDTLRRQGKSVEQLNEGDKAYYYRLESLIQQYSAPQGQPETGPTSMYKPANQMTTEEILAELQNGGIRNVRLG